MGPAAPTPVPPTPIATPVATPTPIGPTPTPSTVQEVVERVRDGVVQVIAGTSTGTGFIFAVESDTAFIITNHHLLEEEGVLSRSINIIVRDSQTYKANLLGFDAKKDLAVVAICCDSNFTALSWVGTTRSPRIGTEIVAVGYARGSVDEVTSTVGKVIGTHNFPHESRHVIWHDAPLNPGNSGSPLLSVEGVVLGINVGSSTTRPNIYGAVSYRTIKEVVGEWKESLVVSGTPTPSPTSTPSESVDASNVVLWVIFTGGSPDSYMNAHVDSGRDWDEFALDVFVDGVELCNSTRIYADEGRYELSCASVKKSHSQVERVSVQSREGDLRCMRSTARSTSKETVFVCEWR